MIYQHGRIQSKTSKGKRQKGRVQRQPGAPLPVESGRVHLSSLAVGCNRTCALQGFSKNPRHSLKKYEVWVQNLILFLPHWVCACMLTLFSHVQLFATLWTVAYQAPQSMELSRQEYWSGLPLPSPGDLPNPGIEPWSPALQADGLPTKLQKRSKKMYSP